MAAAGLVCAVGCAACTGGGVTGTTGPGTIVSVRTMTPTPTRTFTRTTLTAADDGSTVIVHPGETVSVTLTGLWDRPAGSRPGELRTEWVTGAYPSRGPLRFRVRAVVRGRSFVSVASDMGCFHVTPPCRAAVRVWRVLVIVR